MQKVSELDRYDETLEKLEKNKACGQWEYDTARIHSSCSKLGFIR